MHAALPKQYLILQGRPVLLHSLERLCAYPRIRGVMLGVSEHDDHWPKLAGDAAQMSNFLGSFRGGDTRAHTVANGIRALDEHARPEDWILVHDAVRPCLRHEDLDRLIDSVGDYADGGLLAVPVADTVKRADAQDRVLETVARSGLWRAMTPQMFRREQLSAALDAALKEGVEVTDEAMAIERLGGRPRVVTGHPDNIKITYPNDLALADLFLSLQAESRA